MKKLKTKIFLVLFLLLTAFAVTVAVTYNAQNYTEERRRVEDSLNRIAMDKRDDMEDIAPPDERRELGDLKGVMFMDSTVYTVMLEDDDSIEEILNLSPDSMDEAAVRALAREYLASGPKSRSVGNLYFTKYSYSYKKGDRLVIVDDRRTGARLRGKLLISLAAFAAFDLIAFFLTKAITRRIIRPVQESFDKQRRFIADASHELKTPLAVIMASADALERQPEETKWLSNIKSESERMNKLIHDLLTLAKTESDTPESLTTASLSKTVQIAALNFEAVLFEKGLTLRDDIEDGIEMPMAQDRIRQLVSILLDNAVKHSAPNGEIKVRLKRDRDIILTVTNEGEGIPKGEEEKIFERFYRVDASRNRNDDRYGLGLAIAKNIVSLHGGAIRAASENGKTTFTVTFKK